MAKDRRILISSKEEQKIEKKIQKHLQKTENNSDYVLALNNENKVVENNTVENSNEESYTSGTSFLDRYTFPFKIN